CIQGRFGVNCDHICQCTNGGICDKETGQCTCPAGFIGTKCEITCPANRFGEKCEKFCDCENGGTCDRVTGQCRCAAGFTGIRCHQVCSEGRFGPGCREKCRCANQAHCAHWDIPGRRVISHVRMANTDPIALWTVNVMAMQNAIRCRVVAIVHQVATVTGVSTVRFRYFL
ncbi:unnamed protein product, partial [Gongylonema pulchrum]|uniref:EGF-like domain-containing protein n=1 Tax=Gongylonema pulchrum TaxID=637853 RepID=A0A183D6S4_9BILA